MFQLGNGLVCSDHISPPLDTLCRRPSSLCSLLVIHTSEGLKRPGLIGRWSLIGLPKNNGADESSTSATGVFLCCITALLIWSHTGLPSDFVLADNSLLADLTADSALRFECALYSALLLWKTTHYKERGKLMWDILRSWVAGNFTRHSKCWKIFP